MPAYNLRERYDILYSFSDIHPKLQSSYGNLSILLTIHSDFYLHLQLQKEQMLLNVIQSHIFFNVPYSVLQLLTSILCSASYECINDSFLTKKS